MVNTVPLENVSSYVILAKDDTMSQVTILELLQWNKKGASSTNKNSSAPTLDFQRPRRSGDAPSAISVAELFLDVKDRKKALKGAYIMLL